MDRKRNFRFGEIVVYAFTTLFSAHSADDLTLERKPTSVDTTPELAHGNHIACAACSVEVTQAIFRIAVKGRHRHTFPLGNGDGVEVGCFSLAPGCRAIGHFQLDFSGEDDGMWQTVFCATCGAHLGWRYQSARDLGFFALILDRLKTPPEDNADTPR